MKINATLVAALAAVVAAAPRSTTTGNHVVHEKRHLVSNSPWIKRDAIHGDTRLPVRIALKQRNLDKGMDYLMEVSDPNSPSYGKHYTQDQVVELFAPSDESIATVKKWLVDSGIPASSILVPKSKGWISFESTASQLESVLKTKYHIYNHARSEGDHVGADEYKLPAYIAEHVDFIKPAVAFMRKPSDELTKKRAASSAVRPTFFRPLDEDLAVGLTSGDEKAAPSPAVPCSKMITPECIKQMYGIPPADLAHPDNAMGIYETDKETYAQEDLDNFFALAAPNIPKGTHPIANIIGNTTAVGPVASAGGEATLDYDMAYPIVYPQKIVDFQLELVKLDLFDTFLDAIDGTFCNYTAYGQTGNDPVQDGDTSHFPCGKFKPTNVISISYGLAESDYPVNYQKRQCDEYMKLGLQGTTLLLASGDYGVAEEPCLGPNNDIFVADSASSCPYMTAVGSTYLPVGSNPGDEEWATASFASGGGFSNIYPRPKYQEHAVNRYFISHDPGFKSYNTTEGVLPNNGGIYNRQGRAYPDLSAVGDYGLVYVRGRKGLSGGTSMSAPIIGGIINRINEERLKAGKSPVGFINPAIYAYQEMFTDVVHGDQYSNGACKNKAFSAVRGWDPVTGMGTPKYEKMLEIFMGL